MTTALLKFDAARNAIIEAASIDEVRDIRDKAEAARVYVKQAGDSLEMQNRCAEIKIRAERRCGEILADSGIGRGNKSVTLTDFGVDHNQSKRWQSMARIPETVFEQHIREMIENQQELTSASVQRLAKLIENSERDQEIVESQEGSGILEGLIESGQKFATIYADPPWQYGNQGTRAATNNHYPTMPIGDIEALPVKDIAEDKALLFLWTTNGFLADALNRIIPAWGFTFKSSMVWVKPQMGIGNYVRNAHEFLLIANRGGLLPNGKSQISWVNASREKHSKKPDVFRDTVARLSPGPRLEMFARQTYEGWHSWGNQITEGVA